MSRLSVVRDTSRDAYQRRPGSLDDLILAHLRRAPATCEEIELATGRKHAAVSGNLRHLVEAGLVEPTAERRPTSSNRKAIVWRLAPRLPVLGAVEPDGQVTLFGSLA